MSNQEPWLVIMAAGMGSRFGGLKQITPVDAQGQFIIDFSLYDAWRAGFRKVAFIIKREMEADFRRLVLARIEGYFQIAVIYQELDRLPNGFSVPGGREKPWGTGHAVACCQGVVDGPFAVINADDFYGRTSFQSIFNFLCTNEDARCYAMIGYRLRNTVTDNGSVARGVCEVRQGELVDVIERTKIFRHGEDAMYTEDGETFVPLKGDTIVSMNFWGFGKGMLDALWNRMPAFLEAGLARNPLKCEYFLPFVVNEQLQNGAVRVRVLPTEEKWYGVTYRDDLDGVCRAIAQMKQNGTYPEELWK